VIRVVYDHQAFARQPVGGITRYLCEIAKRIDRTDGFRADIVAPIHFNSHLRDGEARVYGKYVPQIPRTGNLIRAVNTILSPPLFRILKPSIVHETYYYSKRLAPTDVPIVVTVYDMIHERYSEGFRTDDPTSSQKRAAVERADHVICISQNTQKDLVELFGIPIAKTSVILLGFSLPDSALDRARNIPQAVNQPFLLYVGHRGSWKNFKGLLDAYASSSFLRKDFFLLVFGGGPLAPAELNRIRELGLPEGSVRHLTGDDALLASLYRKASLFVCPSLYEGFGIPPLEAMSFDCPVACSNTSSLPEVVGNAARLFDPADIESLTAAIEEVVSSRETQIELVRRGRERIKLFSWDRCATETTSVYRSLTT
jgi:glycosyltransferase involved in cell wall biosynthesis